MRIEELLIAETENYIAINKPAGLLSIPGRDAKEISLKQLLQARYGSVFTVHRLDKDTSGLIIFARNETYHKHLSAQFESRQARKIYHGLVVGQPIPAAATVEQPIMEHPVKKGVMTVGKKGKQSITDYEVVENLKLFSWMRFRIHTGRTHQIRVHMKYVGHPIACDEIYGLSQPILLSQVKSKFNLSKKDETERPLLQRLALHASELQCSDVNGEALYFEAPLAKDLKATLNQLRKHV